MNREQRRQANPRRERSARLAGRRMAVAAAITMAVLPQSGVAGGQQSDPSDVTPDMAVDPALELFNPDAAADVKLTNALGEIFAGTWRDPDSGRRQVTAVVVGDSVSDQVRAALGDEAFDLVEVDHSKSDLEELRQTVESVLGSAGEHTYLFGVNVPENRVDAAVAGDSPALDDLRELERTTSGVSVRTAEISPTYDVTDRGGVRQYTEVGSNWYASCTTGFALDHQFGRVMSSAGHCTSTSSGQPVFNALGDNCSPYACPTGASVGSVIYRSTSDVMIYGRAGAIGKVWNGTGYITVKGAEDVQWLEGDVCWRFGSERGLIVAG